jgi:hypothetical protein
VTKLTLEVTFCSRQPLLLAHLAKDDRQTEISRLKMFTQRGRHEYNKQLIDITVNMTTYKIV